MRHAPEGWPILQAPSLPSVEANADSIEAAKDAFRAIEEKFPAVRAKYLDEILPEAFAVVKNAARRLVGQSISVCGNVETI